ncbi:MAG TPA: hypothetical protein VFS67_26915 [Polyangiaceae bacterium]|nr:hypothetical protein [Polyangiaceae bacterium]
MKALQLIAVLATALLLGTTFAPVLEMPSKLALSAAEWRTVQATLVRPCLAVGGPLELFTVGINLAVLAAALSRPQLLVLTAGSTVCLVLAFAVWVVFTEPVNVQVLQWTSTTLPPDWNHWREQWEFSQLIRFLLHLTGLVLLAASLLNLPIEEVPASTIAHRTR